MDNETLQIGSMILATIGGVLVGRWFGQQEAKSKHTEIVVNAIQSAITIVLNRKGETQDFYSGAYAYHAFMQTRLLGDLEDMK